VSDPDLAQRAAPVDPVLRTPRWGLGDAVVGWVLSLAGAVLALSAVVAVTGDPATDISLGWANIAQIGLWIPLLGVPLWAARLKGNGAVRDYGLRVEPIDGLVGPIAGFASQLVLLPLLYIPIFWLTNSDTDDLGETARNLTDRADDPFSVAMLVILTGIGAPIVEEIFYRGLLLRSLERRFGQVAAVVVSGLVFGAVHFQLLPLPGLALFGMVLGYLTVKTGRLGAPIAAHMAFNMVTVISLLAVD
jgi:membrane protease YdiL (CAAX protease family)